MSGSSGHLLRLGEMVEKRDNWRGRRVSERLCFRRDLTPPKQTLSSAYIQFKQMVDGRSFSISTILHFRSPCLSLLLPSDILSDETSWPILENLSWSFSKGRRPSLPPLIDGLLPRSPFFLRSVLDQSEPIWSYSLLAEYNPCSQLKENLFKVGLDGGGKVLDASPASSSVLTNSSLTHLVMTRHYQIIPSIF